jgi:predicted GIY-YIG superfamily endonuclease
MTTVYILKCSDNSYYTGCTSDLEARIERHNEGKVKSTSYRIPVNLVTYISFTEKHKAYFFEKYLKSGSGRAFMNKRFI